MFSRRGKGKSCDPKREAFRGVWPLPEASPGLLSQAGCQTPSPRKADPTAGDGEGLGDYSDLSLLVCLMRLTVAPAVAGPRTRPTTSKLTAAEDRGDPLPLGQIGLGEGRAVVGPSKTFAPSEAPPKEPVGPQHGAATEDARVREEETQTLPSTTLQAGGADSVVDPSR